MDELYEIEFEKLVSQIKAYNPLLDVDFLKKTYSFSYEAHKGQQRRSGRPYFEHCLETAKILVNLRLDTATIAGGLLHDVIEDTDATLDDLEHHFGKEVASLVDGISRIRRLRLINSTEEQVENYRKLLLSVVKDIRVILVKLADRLHNMRTLKYLPLEKQKEVSIETRDLYVPLAHRLGLGKIKWELEDLVFKFLENERYKELANKVAEKRGQREEYIEKIAAPIREALATNNIEAAVEGRPKSIYSIYNKIKNRNVPFDEMYDLFALRIIVRTVEECYSALAVVHGIFTPCLDKHKDLIEKPKDNGYKSLHTVVLSKENKVVEIQIRTAEMHKIAEEGIAAHWRYKEGKFEASQLDQYLVEFRRWLRQLAEQSGKPGADADEFKKHLEVNFFQNVIFVYTPESDLIQLPVNGTPVDFAFAVHSKIGLHCLGAKVNRQIVSLDHKLKSGDSVEIITSANQRPNPDWLKFVRTARARHEIKHWIKESMQEQSRKLGEEIIKTEFKENDLKKEDIDLDHIARTFSLSDENHLYREIGYGNISINKIIKKILAEQRSAEKNDDYFRSLLNRVKKSSKGAGVAGLENLLIRFGKCCQPLPGDHIVGFITGGNGMRIHRSDCKNVPKLMENPERNLEVKWNRAEDDARFLIRLRMLGYDRKNFLRDIGDAIAQTNSSLVSVEMRSDEARIHGHLIIEVNNLLHLTRVINRICKVNGVLNVERLDGAGEPVADLVSDVSPVWNKAN